VADIAKIARRIETELKAGGNAERASGEKNYLKSDLTFFGARLGHIRSVAKSVARTDGLPPNQLAALVRELWSKQIFERRTPQSSSST
jgi:hypothetical protein